MDEAQKAASVLVEKFNSETGYEHMDGESSIGQVIANYHHLTDNKDFLIAVLVAISEGRFGPTEQT